MAKHNLEEGRPEGSNREPGFRQEHPPITGLNESSFGTLQLVNSDRVARVVDEQGKPLVVFYCTAGLCVASTSLTYLSRKSWP